MLKNNKFIDRTAGLMTYSVVILILAVISGCSGQLTPEKPDNLIPEDRYIDLLVEMQNIQSYRNAEPDSVNADSLKMLVFKSYNVSDSQFLASHKYYQLQPDIHLAQIDSVLERLDNEELEIRAFIDSVQSEKQKRDSIKTAESLGKKQD